MSILATRVGHLPTPRLVSATVCWRCGVEFDRASENVIVGAPCRDCREILRGEGDTTVWSSRKPKGAAA